ncbi:hypothetical protein Acid345_4686 [Candidatus Koribacter versatilis Ellin345]|uniref:Uncharacterized protein n=1 Tax=Koribacter versatilis (strain Ellin345) TaxID=204669 RepID=Q1IHG4_KORVE|nr:hypothetical protein [Candidatus Koribacter versatilis]ABF43686.1 hypothetical protein Acid345_4686 [Candidatus Koribacter versatilis Ellin345]
MKSRRSKIWIAVAVLVILAAIGGALYLRKHAAPEPARLLPDGDAILYANLKPVRVFSNFGKEPQKGRDPDYQDFVNQTGFEFERDLDEAAVSEHGALVGAMGPDTVPPATRFSWIFVGRFNSEKLTGWLKARANDADQYRGASVYSIPLQGRTVRVAILSVDTVAASNVDGSQDIHGIIDRYRASALPVGGPSLVRSFYKNVPIGSVLWTILRTNTAGEHSSPFLPGDASLFVPANTTIVLSARALTSVHVQADLFTPSENDAKKFKQKTDVFLALFKGVETNVGVNGNDKDVKDAFDNIKVEQTGATATISAVIPFDFFKKLLADTPEQVAQQPAPEPVAPPAPAPKKPVHKKSK